MKNIDSYLNSGILELYVLGLTDEEESKEVFQLSLTHPEIRKEIDSIISALQIESSQNIEIVKPTLKTSVLAAIDYIERLKSGEIPASPPFLTKETKIIEFQEWINRDDIVLPNDFEEYYAKIIGYTPQATTSISWVKNISPIEIHINEFERFFILEGTCDVVIEGVAHSLVPGDFIEIPLNAKHYLKATSNICCKFILQHVAA